MIRKTSRRGDASSQRRSPLSQYTYASGYTPAARATYASKPKFKSARRYKLMALGLLMVCLVSHTAWSQHVSAEAAATKREQQIAQAVQSQKAAQFRNFVTTTIAAHPELHISVVITPQTSAMQQFGSDQVFDAASTAKLLTAADALRHVEQGHLSLHSRLSDQTVQSLLKVMIIDSDDNAWATLNGYLGHADLQHYAQTIGITDYDADTNTLTATDITLLLQKLYNRQLLSSSSRTLLLSYLAQANHRDFIVPAVPAGDTVYHKIGMDDDSVHDTAIITNGVQSFELTIFTDGNGTYEWPARAVIMQAITKAAINAYL